MLTIVMYHYVRDLRRSRFPDIKGLTVEGFLGQLDYLQKHYCLVGMDRVIGACAGDAGLPTNAALLTFDDGYVDHYRTVFPILFDRMIPGAFFPPVNPVRHGRVLDVNKIHFILAASPDKRALMDHVIARLADFGDRGDVATMQDYVAKFARPSRHDPAEVVFVKRLLQVALPEDVRSTLIDELFRVRVSADEAAFSMELYTQEAEWRVMIGNGMHVGAHGAEHYWMDRLDPADQEREIGESVEFLRSIGANPDAGWVMCYPYGAYNHALVDLLRRRGCKVGLTTEVDVADMAGRDPLILPRLDTNDLPKTGSAPANAWTQKVLAAAHV